MMNDPTVVDHTIGRWLRPTPVITESKTMLIFIAVPTSGVAARGRLFESFPRDVALLHLKFPQHTFIAPMIQDYALLPHMSVEATWEEWGHHCRTIIERCDQVWVLMYKGYDTSVGVAAEVKHAEENGVPVCWLALPLDLYNPPIRVQPGRS